MNSKNNKSEKIKQLLNNPGEVGFEFIADPQEYEREVIEGYTMEVLRYGFPLDNFCPYKQGQLTVVVGHYNLGKTTVLLWLLSRLAKQGKKLLIFSSENRISDLYGQFLKFYYNCEKQSVEQVKSLRDIIRFIKPHRQFSYKDILNQATFLLDADFDFDIMLIDPYNTLKMENEYRLSSHEYHYEAIDQIKIFTTTTNKSIFLNCHTVTEAQREKPDSNGYTPVPLVSMVEGGGKFPNRADDCMVIHRHTQAMNEEDRYVTEIHVGKVRNQRFGGRQTPWTEPVKIKFRRDWTGFDQLTYDKRVTDYKQLSYND